MTIHEQIVENLKEVYDPEISVNVYDLGLIYDISIKDQEVIIKHTLTSVFCSFADELVSKIVQAGYVEGITNVSSELTFDPPFTMDMVPEETKLMLGWI